MIKVLALSLPRLSQTSATDAARKLGRETAPWLSKTQRAHVRSFGSSPSALEAALSRLLARKAALMSQGFGDILDRDGRGRAFFSGSAFPCAFTHPKGAAFCAISSEPLEPGALAIDAELMPPRPDKAMAAFLKKLYPGLAAENAGARLTALLWTAHECLFKIYGERVPPGCLSENFKESLNKNNAGPVHVFEAGLHFSALTSRGYAVTLACRDKSALELAWQSGAALCAAPTPFHA